jgi:hypothetical protein
VSVETLSIEADGILQDTATDHVPLSPDGKEYDPGFILSFFNYPAGHALEYVSPTSVAHPAMTYFVV